MSQFADRRLEPLSDRYGLDRGTPRGGGALLATAPALSRLSPTFPDRDFWHFTAAGMSELLGQRWPGRFSVYAFGNLRTCVGFLLGEVVEDLSPAVIDEPDSRLPLTVGVAATKA